MDRKHDGDAILIFRHEARRPVEERGAGAQRRVMKLMSLIAESHVTPALFERLLAAFAAPVFQRNRCRDFFDHVHERQTECAVLDGREGVRQTERPLVV
jgi:hypothetical protein